MIKLMVLKFLHFSLFNPSEIKGHKQLASPSRAQYLFLSRHIAIQCPKPSYVCEHMKLREVPLMLRT